MGIKRCIESPLKDRFCVRWHVLGLMKLDKSIFKGIAPIVIDRKRLSHPNQPSHINGGDNVCMFNGSGERDSGSAKTVFFVF